MSVYFAERDGLVKIGYSANVDRRMLQLGARLLATMPGGQRMERLMHMYFAEYKAGLPDEYWHAEADRIIAAERAEEARAKLAKQQERPVPYCPAPSASDRAAAAAVGRALIGALNPPVSA